MRFLTLVIASAVCVSPSARGTELAGPDSVIIGGKGTSGAVGVGGYSASGFKGGPVVDIHTTASGVRVSSVIVNSTSRGAGTFSYTVEYTGTTPDSFELELSVSSGTGWKSDGFERMRVKVRRD